jgi:hypothetical protein
MSLAFQVSGMEPAEVISPLSRADRRSILPDLGGRMLQMLRNLLVRITSIQPILGVGELMPMHGRFHIFNSGLTGTRELLMKDGAQRLYWKVYSFEDGIENR